MISRKVILLISYFLFITVPPSVRRPPSAIRHPHPPSASALYRVPFDTSMICHVLVYCFFSFLLQDIFLSLQEFAFEGQNMTFTVNVLFTCIIYCDAGPGYDWNCLQVQPINSFHGYHICLPTCFFRKLYACLAKFLCFLQPSDRAKFLEVDGQRRVRF